MTNKFNLKYIWLAVGCLSMFLMILMWFGYDSPHLQNAIHVFDALMLILSLPCSLFVVPVVVLANNYLGINPLSTEGINLATIFLFALGLMQWFWIARFWSPGEAPFQMINLPDAEAES